MLSFLKIKLILIIIGIIITVIGVTGLFAGHYCETNPEAISQAVENKISEPLTIDLLATLSSAIKKIGSFFVNTLCPLINWVDKLLPLYYYIIIGVVLIIIGSVIP